MRFYLTSLILIILFINCSNKIETENNIPNVKIEKQENKLISINIDKPEGWFDESNIDLLENLHKYKLENKDIDDLMRSHNGSIPIAIYMKYDRRKHAGVIPTIQVILRPYTFNNFKVFKIEMEKSMAQMGEMLENFKVIKDMTDIEINNRKGIHFIASFEMPLENENIKIRSWTYAIPAGKYFYQINFSDMNEEDYSVLYEELIKNTTFGD